MTSRMSEQLAYIIATANKRLEDELHERLRPAGIPIEQLRILEIVHAGDGCSMRELATLALIEPTTLTKIIDRMVSDNLVMRAPDPEDRRRVLIRITQQGRVLFRRLDRITTSQEDRLQKQFPVEKIAELRRLLTELIES
jgi:DNA-binding MarR family transcriptional regulator